MNSSSENYCLRPMRHADVDAVYVVEKMVHPFPWSKQIFHDCLTVGYEAWVIQARDELLGFALISHAANESHILNVSVVPSAQGKGLGKQLLQQLLLVAKKKQSRVIYLEVRASNAAAIALYTKAGFAQNGERKDYYPANDGREDALIFSIHV